MLTGADLYRNFQRLIGAPYTGYVDTTKADAMFRRAYIKVVQDIYRERLTDQNSFDQLSYLIALGAVRQPESNEVYHSAVPIASISYIGTTVTVITELPHGMQTNDTFTIRDAAAITNINDVLATVTINVNPTQFEYTAAAPPVGVATANTGRVEETKSYFDYLHYLYGTALFIEPVYIALASSTNTNPLRVTFTTRPKFRDGDRVRFAGATSNININGDRYLKQLKEKVYALYNDINFQSPVVGNGVHGGTVTVSWIIETPLKPKPPDEKGASLGIPMAIAPYFQQTKLKFQFLPTTVPCMSVTMDYIRKPPQSIDTANAVIDLERYYPFFFLDKLSVEASRQFAFFTRDGNLASASTEELIENP